MPADSNFLRAGAGRSDLTPPTDTPLLGYEQRTNFFPSGEHDGVRDPLFATVLVLDNGHTRLVLVTLDLAIVETPCGAHLRTLAARAAGTAPEHVVIACSHTHSGPFPWRAAWGEGEKPVEDVSPSLLGPAATRFADQLDAALISATTTALADLAPARLRHRETSLTLGYCRRVPNPSRGVDLAWDLREWTGPEPEPAADPTLGLLLIERDARPPLLLWNAAAHPVVLGKRSNVVSADWPGAVRRRLEAAHPGTLSLFLHGAGGDVHPWLATGENPADLDLVAAPAAALLDLLAHTPGGYRNQDNTLHAATATADTSLGPVRLAAWRLGPVRLLAVPGELFGSTGAALRQRCGGNLLLATTADGWTGYWPPEDEYYLGGYEVDAAPRKQPDDTARLARAASALLGRVS